MLISHKYKFIFIKTEKTAGTSVEVALSKYLGPDDVITPISEDDEAYRRSQGCRGPQNLHPPLSAYSLRDWARLLVRRRRQTYFNHASASFIKRYVGNRVWGTYYKFCVERNPWDKTISWYYWFSRERRRLPISDFLNRANVPLPRGYSLYTINGEVVVDCILRFERLEDDLELLAERIGLPEVPSLPRLKGLVRRDRRHYRDVFTPEDAQRVADRHRREIVLLGYQW